MFDMQALLDLFAQHGSLALGLAVLTEQLGSPLPSLPFLLLAGAQSGDALGLIRALAVSTGAAMSANALWFWAGRRLGRRVLTTLCRISISPDSCLRQNELSFLQRGANTLLIAKFVPGLSILAPPLAGALGMTWHTFLAYNLAGAVLWAGTGLVAGHLFQAEIDGLLGALDGLGQIALLVAGSLLGAYIAWRPWRRWQMRRALTRIERIQPGELALRLSAGQELLVIDVRAASPALPLGERIPGARHLDTSRLDVEAIAAWPVTAELVTYCACPNDASAAKAAQWLGAQGRRALVLAGGIEAWAQAGHRLEAA
jgi:membrane protein DedA with SNARE-associated domain/rhodanese-related sulfurtransferase